MCRLTALPVSLDMWGFAPCTSRSRTDPFEDSNLAAPHRMTVTRVAFYSAGACSPSRSIPAILVSSSNRSAYTALSICPISADSCITIARLCMYLARFALFPTENAPLHRLSGNGVNLPRTGIGDRCRGDSIPHILVGHLPRRGRHSRPIIRGSRGGRLR